MINKCESCGIVGDARHGEWRCHGCTRQDDAKRKSHVRELEKKAERLDAVIEELRAANKKMHHALKSIARHLNTYGGHSEPDSATAYIVAMDLVADDL